MSGRLTLPVTLKFIVKCQLCSFANVFGGENGHADVLAHYPFLQHTIRIAAVVDKSGESTAFCGVNDLEDEHKRLAKHTKLLKMKCANKGDE